MKIVILKRFRCYLCDLLFLFIIFAQKQFTKVNMEDNLDAKGERMTLKAFLKSGNFWKTFLGIGLGGLGGFLYYHFVGCSSGSCAITGSPYLSTVYGSLLGLFLVKSPCSRGKC